MFTRKILSPYIEIAVDDGLGLLDVRGHSDLGGALIFKGQVATAIWNAFDGSIGQFLLSAPNQHYREIGSHFHAIAGSEVYPENLEEIALSVLRLFSNGSYSVHLEDFDLDSDFWIYENYSQYSTSFSEFYPNLNCILDTIPEPTIENDVIEEWQSKIRNQIKSCVVLLGSPHEFGYFVIDGHHRLKAYLKENISPRAIVIHKLNPQELIVEDLNDFDIKGFFLASKAFSDK